MKKILFFIITAIWTTCCYCQTVTKQLSETVAANHFRTHYDNAVSVQSIVPHYQDTVLCFYKVNMSNGAWCLIPSTMMVEPVLMYGTSPFDSTDLSPAFLNLIEWYKIQISNIIKGTDSTRMIPPSWIYLLDSSRNTLPYYSGTKLLNEARDTLQRWRQGKNNEGGCSPSYNKECPEIYDLTHLCVIPNGFLGLDTCDCGRKPTGCAAVAMGQVMWYWQWPRKSEYREYHWESMPPIMKNNTDPWEASNIAHLLRDCGDATDMGYCCFGSWATSENIVNAFHETFGYNTATRYKKDEWIYSTAWNDLIKSEIDNRRPVIMYGDTIGWFNNGHFFVLDGYRYENGQMMYHVNWGHGQNNDDTYCLLNLMHEGGSVHSQHNRVIVGISPTYKDENITSLTYSVVPKSNKRVEYAYNRVAIPESGGSLTVQEKGQLKIEAGHDIILQPGFYAQAGSDVDIRINEEWLNHKDIVLSSYSSYATIGQPYNIETKYADSWEFFVYTMGGSSIYQSAGSIVSDYACLWDGNYQSLSPGNYFCTLILKNSYGRKYSIDYYLIVYSNTTANAISSGMGLDVHEYDVIYDSIAVDSGDLDLYPNPTSGEVTVGVDGEVQAIIIYTPMGLPVGGWRLLSIGADRVTLDLSPLPAGTYILHIQTPMGVSTKRLVVAR